MPIPFQNDGHRRGDAREQFHARGIRHATVVIDWQRHVIVAGDMYPGDVRPERIEEGFWSLSEPSFSHQQVVEVEMNWGAAALVQLVEHFPWRNVPGDRRVLRDILQRDTAPKERLRFVHTSHHVLERFVGARQWEQR